MKRIKRTLAALLTVVLTLALLGEAVFADNSEQPVWPEEGAIQLSKSAAAVEGKENTWEVTLGIQGKNYKTTSDVVLVIDNSNSMYDKSRRKRLCRHAAHRGKHHAHRAGRLQSQGDAHRLLCLREQGSAEAADQCHRAKRRRRRHLYAAWPSYSPYPAELSGIHRAE